MCLRRQQLKPDVEEGFSDSVARDENMSFSCPRDLDSFRDVPYFPSGREEAKDE